MSKRASSGTEEGDDSTEAERYHQIQRDTVRRTSKAAQGIDGWDAHREELQLTGCTFSPGRILFLSSVLDTWEWHHL